jgi:hypothetical protein
LYVGTGSLERSRRSRWEKNRLNFERSFPDMRTTAPRRKEETVVADAGACWVPAPLRRQVEHNVTQWRQEALDKKNLAKALREMSSTIDYMRGGCVFFDISEG